MKNQYFDPNVKNIANDEDIVEQEESVDTDEEIIEGEDHEWVNPTDLDAVDPEDIGLGEEYF